MYDTNRGKENNGYLMVGIMQSEISKLSFTCVKKIMTNPTCSTVINLKTTEETMLSDFEARGHQATHDTTAMG